MIYKLFKFFLNSDLTKHTSVITSLAHTSISPNIDEVIRTNEFNTLITNLNNYCSSDQLPPLDHNIKMDYHLNETTFSDITNSAVTELNPNFSAYLDDKQVWEDSDKLYDLDDLTLSKLVGLNQKNMTEMDDFEWDDSGNFNN